MTIVLATFTFSLAMPFGAPACAGPSRELADRSYFLLCHDSSRRVPSWVGYELTPARLARNASRPSHFRRDSGLSGPSASAVDYRHSGYTRGHMAPAADFAFSGDAIRQTFLLSNAVPQTRHLNCGRWAAVEASVRYLASLSDSVVVYTGTLFENPASATIGPNRVAVPSHIYKVVLLTQGSHHVMFAVIAPNIDSSIPTLRALAASVDEVERRTGLDFFPQLPDPEERALEARRNPLPVSSARHPAE